MKKENFGYNNAINMTQTTTIDNEFLKNLNDVLSGHQQLVPSTSIKANDCNVDFSEVIKQKILKEKKAITMGNVASEILKQPRAPSIKAIMAMSNVTTKKKMTKQQAKKKYIKDEEKKKFLFLLKIFGCEFQLISKLMSTSEGHIKRYFSKLDKTEEGTMEITSSLNIFKDSEKRNEVLIEAKELNMYVDV